MLSRISSHLIAILCYHIDRLCRNELNHFNISSERDYVSNLGTHIRFPFGPFFHTKVAISRTLPQNNESIFGCDSIIIFKKGNKAKLALFEAKWPRYFSVPNYQWDSKNKKGISRFSSQIIRQSNWSKSGVYIWEMILNESPEGNLNPPFDEFGSSCLPFNEAKKYMDANKTPHTILWNNIDLLSTLPRSMNFRRIVFNILRCHFGTIFEISGDELNISSDDNKDNVKVPVISSIESLDKRPDNDMLSLFMNSAGLSHYICLDIEEIEMKIMQNRPYKY